MLFLFHLTFLLLCAFARSSSSLRDVFHFPNGTWVENIAVRPNGQLLVTMLTVPQLFQVDPDGLTEPILVHEFTDALGLTGIAEIEPDIFAVISSNNTLTSSVPGSGALQKVDFNTFPPTISKIADIPNSSLLNGMTNFNNHEVLIADSTLGVIWRVDTHSGAQAIVIDDPSLKPSGTALQIGVNGVHIAGDFLYFTSTDQALFGRFPIRVDGTAKGPVEIIAPNLVADDFTLRGPNAYLATNSAGNDVLRVAIKDGTSEVVAGSLDSPALAAVTSVVFGRRRQDRGTLYASTGGMFNGIAEGGKVVAIQLR